MRQHNQPTNNNPSVPHAREPNNSAIGPLTLHTTQIQHLFPPGRHWNPTKHLTPIGLHLFVKIKSHQLRSTGAPKYHDHPQPCYALVHSNHWVDKTCELPYAAPTTIQFPIPCSLVRITAPLYSQPMNLYYGLYPVETDVSDFIASAYQAELILCLATKPETGRYARNMSELQSPNRTIALWGPHADSSRTRPPAGPNNYTRTKMPGQQPKSITTLTPTPLSEKTQSQIP